MIWFGADFHFFHNNIIRLSKRPYRDLHHMHHCLIENWNAKVKNTETGYINGDFLFGGRTRLEKILPQLNGNKILIRGNHDTCPTRHYIDLGFSDVRENERLILNAGNGKKISVYLSHFPWHPMLQYYKKIKPDGSSLVQIVDVDGKVKEAEGDKDTKHSNDRRYLHKRIVDDGHSWLIHGHVHNAWKVLGRQINVGVDVWNYSPVSHHQILKIIEDSENGRR